MAFAEKFPIPADLLPLFLQGVDLHFLFVKSFLAWPRSSGHDVHSYGMMRALAEAGHKVSMLTRDPCSSEATLGLKLERQLTLSSNTDDKEASLAGLQNRHCSFWGIDKRFVSQVGRIANDISADVVVAVGLEVLPYLAAIEKQQRIWYAADEWVLHHLSQFSPMRRSTWEHAKDGAIKGLYEYAFASKVDRVWVVSKSDAWATRLVMHRPNVDVIVNGVDAEFFRPIHCPTKPKSCVFWGRLDFGPNVDAVRWFANRVWPHVLRKHPDATFTLYGFQPIREITDLVSSFGFTLVAGLPDLREEVCQHQVVVLPFVNGAGIKNKLLEAAAMARPIVASRTAMNGVDLLGHSPCRVLGRAGQWLDALTELWENEESRRKLGSDAREWVEKHYTWKSAAANAVEKLHESTK